jgi:hypothetical protein
MAERHLAVVISALLLVALSSCGESPPSFTSAPANTPGATPNDATDVNCPASGGASNGTLTGLGATIGQFRTAHPQDPEYTSQFGATISGGPNDGLAELTASCTTGGVVVFVAQSLHKAMSDAQIKASLISMGIAPADAVFVKARTPVPCKILYYTSASIASDAGANDTAGTFGVWLQPPTSKWEPANVQTLIYALDTAGDC